MNTNTDLLDMKVTLKERIAFGMGDIAANFFLQTIAVFLVIFYTDVLGITAAAAGIVTMASRLFDGVNDIFIGHLADRTGKYKKWVMYGSIASAVLFVTMFLTPNFGPLGKAIYAGLTFSLFTLAYTAYQIPYTTLNSVITDDSHEQMKLNSVRFSIILIPILIVSVGVPLILPPLAKALGSANKAYPVLVGVFGLIGIITSFICVKGVKERVQIRKKEGQTLTFKESMGAIIRNRPLIILVIAWFAQCLQYNMNSAAIPFFFTYVHGNEQLVALFSLIAVPFALVGMLLAPALSKKVGNRSLLIVSGIIIFLLSVLRYFFSMNLLVLIGATAISSIFTGMLNVICFTMVGDTIEYGYKKTGRDVRALNFSFFVFMQKVAMGLSAASIGFVLNKIGYIANVEQTDLSKFGLTLNYTLIPGAIILLLSLSMIFWNIPKSGVSIKEEENV